MRSERQSPKIKKCNIIILEVRSIIRKISKINKTIILNRNRKIETDILSENIDKAQEKLDRLRKKKDCASERIEGTLKI